MRFLVWLGWMTILIGGALLGEIYVMPITHAQERLKPVWDYHCYLTMGGAMDALNGLPAKQAELTKFVSFEHSMLTYCLVIPEK